MILQKVQKLYSCFNLMSIAVKLNLSSRHSCDLIVILWVLLKRQFSSRSFTQSNQVLIGFWSLYLLSVYCMLKSVHHRQFLQLRNFRKRNIIFESQRNLSWSFLRWFIIFSLLSPLWRFFPWERPSLTSKWSYQPSNFIFGLLNLWLSFSSP